VTVLEWMYRIVYWNNNWENKNSFIFR